MTTRAARWRSASRRSRDPHRKAALPIGDAPRHNRHQDSSPHGFPREAGVGRATLPAPAPGSHSAAGRPRRPRAGGLSWRGMSAGAAPFGLEPLQRARDGQRRQLCPGSTRTRSGSRAPRAGRAARPTPVRGEHHAGPSPDDGRGRPRRLSAAQLRDGGRVSAGKLDRHRAALVVIDVQEAFRKAVPGFDQHREATATRSAAPKRSGSRRGHRAVPKGPWANGGGGRERPARGRRADREGLVLGGRGGRLRPPAVAEPGPRLRHRGPRVRQPDGARPPRSGRRGARRRRTRSGLRFERTGGRAPKGRGGGRRDHERRDGALRARRRAGTDEFKRVQSLVLEFARARHEPRPESPATRDARRGSCCSRTAPGSRAGSAAPAAGHRRDGLQHRG